MINFSVVCTIRIDGACDAIIKEPISLDINYPVSWQEPRVDLRELASLRYVHNWSRKQLASHYGRTEDAIQNYFQKI